MSRGTRKPCPGCGESGWRESNKVCGNCRRLLDLMEKIEKSENTKPDEVIVSFAEAPHWNEYFYAYQVGEIGDDLRKSFFRLANAAITRQTLELESEFDLLGKTSSYHPPRYVMSRNLAESIRDLHQMIQPMINAIYEKGKSDGHNLLMRLATGDIAPNQFLKESESNHET